jgi:hypothetical protein
VSHLRFVFEQRLDRDNPLKTLPSYKNHIQRKVNFGFPFAELKKSLPRPESADD